VLRYYIYPVKIIMGTGNLPKDSDKRRKKGLDQKGKNLDNLKDQSKNLMRMTSEERKKFYRAKTVEELKKSAEKLLKKEDKRLTKKENLEKRIEQRIREIQALAKLGK